MEAAAELAADQGSPFEDMDLEEQEAYYQKAKQDIESRRGVSADGTQGSV